MLLMAMFLIMSLVQPIMSFMKRIKLLSNNGQCKGDEDHNDKDYHKVRLETHSNLDIAVHK